MRWVKRQHWSLSIHFLFILLTVTSLHAIICEHGWEKVFTQGTAGKSSITNCFAGKFCGSSGSDPGIRKSRNTSSESPSTKSHNTHTWIVSPGTKHLNDLFGKFHCNCSMYQAPMSYICLASRCACYKCSRLFIPLSLIQNVGGLFDVRRFPLHSILV